MKLKNRILPFYQAIPKLLTFQFVSFLVLGLITWGVSLLCGLLLGLSGKAAVSSGDLGFLFTHWQGYVMIALLLLTAVIYVAVELNALIVYSAKLLNGEKPSVWQSIKGGFASLKKLMNLRGIVVILYAVILAPILGLGFSVSLTSTFYIPRFIMSVIKGTPFFAIGYTLVVILLTVVAVIYCFILHGALLDGMTMKEAGVNSRKLVKRNLKNFLFELLCFLVIAALVIVLLTVIAAIPLLIVQLIPMGETALRFCDILFSLIPMFVLMFGIFLSVSFYILKLTMLYKKYSTEGEWQYQKQEKRRHPILITAVVLVLILCVAVSVIGVNNFDAIFHTQITTEVIAHRAGGVEAPENTVKGIEVAYELGAMGCEIDIQRTSDGYYVVNHDSDFTRVAGVSKTPEEMTLSEVKELRVDGEPVPTLEEMLDASRDRVILFVELKGATADDQMADDAVRIIKEKGMEDQTVLISLKYDILDYIEQKYPEMKTGYLAFISFGEIENTPFDYLALEEEISTADVIDAIHAAGKKIMIWTVNEEDDITYYMSGDADAIITDSVKLSGEIKEQLSKRSTLEIVIQKVFGLNQ